MWNTPVDFSRTADDSTIWHQIKAASEPLAVSMIELYSRYSSQELQVILDLRCKITERVYFGFSVWFDFSVGE